MKIATPISKLFDDKEAAEKLIAKSDCLECRDTSIDCEYPGQQLFHCDLQPIHIWGEKEFEYLITIKKKKAELKLLSFHIASCYDNPSMENHKFIPGGRKLTPAELKYNASINLQKAKEILGLDVLISIENNNNFGTEAYDYVTEPEFIKSIVIENNIWFLFDITHAKISSHYTKMPFDDYKKILPLNRMIQIHISKFGYNDSKEMIDAHELPGDDEINEVKLLLSQFKSVKYLTVEFYKNIDHLIVFLESVKKNLVV